MACAALALCTDDWSPEPAAAAHSTHSECGIEISEEVFWSARQNLRRDVQRSGRELHAGVRAPSMRAGDVLRRGHQGLPRPCTRGVFGVGSGIIQFSRREASEHSVQVREECCFFLFFLSNQEFTYSTLRVTILTFVFSFAQCVSFSF